MTAIVFSLVALIVSAGALSGGGGIFAVRVWQAMMASRIGDAFRMRLAGLLAIASLASGLTIAPHLAVAVAFAVPASCAAMGHAMLHRPRQAIAALVVHLGPVSFRVGSLVPPARLARGRDGGTAILADWSRIARPVVAILIASGLALAAPMVRRFDVPFATGDGWGSGAKPLLVGGMLARRPACLRSGARGGASRARSGGTTRAPHPARGGGCAGRVLGRCGDGPDPSARCRPSNHGLSLPASGRPPMTPAHDRA